MAYAESKVYYDGSHYIAIPHTERRPRKRPRREEELVEVKEPTPEETPSGNEAESSPPAIEDEPFRAEIDGVHFEELTEIEDAPFGPPKKEEKKKPPSKMTTRKEIFKTAYEERRLSPILRTLTIAGCMWSRTLKESKGTLFAGA